MIIEVDFRESNKTVKIKFDSETFKLWPVNLLEKRRDIVGVHQRSADSLKLLESLFVLSQPDPSNVMSE